MGIYQALQLNAAGSKALIKSAETKREKRKWQLVYLFKVLLTVAFCFLFVTGYSLAFGSDNSIAGVVVLLSLMVLRFADFGIRTEHSVAGIFLVFGILILGPHISNAVGPWAAFCINAFCILMILILSCHNILMSNHSTFVMGYLLLQGYDVSGKAFEMRIVSLLLGAVICAAVFYRNHKKVSYKRSFADLFREFDLNASRTQWYLTLSLGIASALLIASLLHVPRAMWIGISAMSVLHPFAHDMMYRVKRRIPFGAIGCAAFAVIYMILPESLYPFIGILGGIGVGFSATYSWQTVFNSFGALAVAMGLFGVHGAIFLRIALITAGSVYGMAFHSIMQKRPWNLFRRNDLEGGIE